MTLQEIPCCEHCMLNSMGECADLEAGGHLDPCPEEDCPAHAYKPL